MGKLAVLNGVTRGLSKAVLLAKKHSPEILIVAGAVGTVASTVLACKATIKAKEIVDQAKDDLDVIHTVNDDKELCEQNNYTEEQHKKDVTAVYAQTGIQLVKTYAPAVALGMLSLTAMVASNQILRKRNVALTAAYTAVHKSFKQYRGRVIERFGEEIDHELRYNIKAKEIEEKVVNEDGTETVVKKTVHVPDEEAVKNDAYSFFFDECSPNWSKDPEYNKLFLVKQQNYFTDKLRRKGHLFLNEVLDGLGIDRTPTGAVAGWIYSEKEDHEGDNFVDFGIFDIANAASRRFVNGYEKNVLLNFNVDGVIYDKI